MCSNRPNTVLCDVDVVVPDSFSRFRIPFFRLFSPCLSLALFLPLTLSLSLQVFVFSVFRLDVVFVQKQKNNNGPQLLCSAAQCMPFFIFVPAHFFSRHTLPVDQSCSSYSRIARSFTLSLSLSHPFPNNSEMRIEQRQYFSPAIKKSSTHTKRQHIA